MLNTTQEQMKEEIINELKVSGKTVDAIRDDAHEWVENYVPIYNGDIIREWQVMPSEYDNQGVIELGYDGDADIVRQMSLDLYLYYSAQFSEMLDELETEYEEED